MADDDKLGVSLGYPLAQLAKAVAAAGGDASARIARWQKVVAGLLDGTLRVGARDPIQGVPAWVTPEVVHGGFVTGALAAGGPLLPHEAARLPIVTRPPKATERTALNLHFVGDVGRAELDGLLESGRFRVRVPEEGALLVFAWLLRRGEVGRATALLETITPLFDRLRFYPVPHSQPVRSGTGVAVETAGDVVARLRARRPQAQVARMNEALRVWTPLQDRALALFAETSEDGWPCRRYPPGWDARARELLDDHRRARARHTLCGKPDKPKENFARLRGYLEVCVADRTKLTGRDVGMIRKILASVAARHGAPGSERLAATRAAQARVAAMPTHDELARAVADRLAQVPQDEGLPDVELLLEEASPAAPLPRAVKDKALRCLEAPVATLVERGLVSSSEALARVLPPLTARVRAEGIVDAQLRRVFEAVYVAFRRRRSLLLLDLASQVKLGELPWIAAAEPWLGSDQAARAASRETLARAATLAIGAFPFSILPNKLVKELRALAAGAGLDLPLVDELAADIFTGLFSASFLRAGKAAAALLEGTLYERYFGVPFAAVRALDDVTPLWGTPSSPGFAHLCRRLAPTAPPGVNASDVAERGAVIEQAQIVTTHNLAVLFGALALGGALELPVMARRTFEWICRSLQRHLPDWRAQLRNMKNGAYAWRQLIFYLSLLSPTEVRSFLEWTAARLAAEPAAFQERFAPVVAGLRAVLDGERFDAAGVHAASGGRRWLGWSLGRHWLLPPRGPAAPGA